MTRVKQLAAHLRARKVPLWVHSTGLPPRQSGFKQDPLCLQAAVALEAMAKERKVLLSQLKEAADLFKTAADGGGVDFYAASKEFSRVVADFEESQT